MSKATIIRNHLFNGFIFCFKLFFFFFFLLFLVHFKLVYCAGIVGIWQHRADFSSPWNGAYYGGQVYDGYGYALPPPHDPSTYAAAYGAYPMYGHHQQQVS